MTRIGGEMAHLIPAFFTKVAICMLVFAIASGCVTEAPAAGDEVLIRKFFELREQMLDQRGTPAQVQQIQSLFKDGGQYEHPAFSVILTLDEAKSGMIAHLKEGRDARITINRIFHGSNFAVAETTPRYFIPDESGRLKKKIERNGVAIFELEAARIVRVAEY
jgi:hypothetical protein